MNCLKFLIPFRENCNVFKKILYLIRNDGMNDKSNFLVDIFYLKMLPIYLVKLYANLYKYDFLYEKDSLIYRNLRSVGQAA